MNRYSNLSPQNRNLPLIRIVSSPDEKDHLILSLQSKLQSLESNYSKFVEKCSTILKSEALRTECKDYFSEHSSSVRFSPEPVGQIPLEEHEKLLNILKEIQEGFLTKQHMNDISTLTDRALDLLLKRFKSSNISADLIQSTFTSLKSSLWEAMIQKEDVVKLAVQGCLVRFQEFDKVLEESIKALKTERKLKEFQEKYKKSQEDNNLLLKKIKEQQETLSKIKEDYSRLKSQINPLTLSKLPSPKNLVQSLYSTNPRSHCSSPHTREDELKKLRETNQNLHHRVKLLSQQNTVLQHYKRTSASSEPKDFYEYEKKEIQGQLKALQYKLTGFEKVAKSLIDSSIRAELEIIGQCKIKEPYSKPDKDHSQDDSCAHTPLSLLELDQVQKNLEAAEKEKNFLAESLKKEQMKNTEILALIGEKDKKIRKLNEEIEKLCKMIEQDKENLIKWKIEKQEFEVNVKDLNEIIKELMDKALDYQGKLEAKDLEIRELNGKLRANEEEKIKVVNLLAKHKENEKKLEDNLKKWGEDYSKMQEVISNTKNIEKNLEVNQVTVRFNKKIQELEEKIVEFVEKEAKMGNEIKSLVALQEKLVRENSGLNEKLKKTESDLNFTLNQELQLLNQSLENSQKDAKKAKSDLDSCRKLMEKRIIEKDKIISSFELKNHENFQLSCDLSELKLKYEKISKQNEELQVQNLEVNKKLNEIQEVVQVKDKTIEDFDQENKETSKKIQNLTENLHEFQKLIKETTIKLKQSEDQNSKLQLKLEKIQLQIAESEKTEEELLHSIEERNKLIENLTKDLQSNNSFEDKLIEYQEKIKELVDEKQNLAKKINLLEGQMINKDKTIESKEKMIEELTQANKSISSQICQMETKAKFTELLKKLELKENEIKDLEIKLEKSEENSIKLNMDLDQQSILIDNLKSQIKGKEQESLELKLQINKLKDSENQNKSLKSQINAIETELKEVISEVEEKRKIIQELENQISKLNLNIKTDSDKNKEKINELEKTIKSLNQELKEAKLTLINSGQESSKKFQYLEKENEKLKTKENEIKEIESKLEINEENLIKLQMDLDQQALIIDNLKAQIKGKEQESYELKVQISKLKESENQNKLLKSQIDAIQTELKETVSEVEEKQVIIEELESQISTLNEEYKIDFDNNKEKIDELEANIKILKKELKDSKRVFTESGQEFNKKFQYLEKENEKLKTREIEMREELRTLSDENSSLQRQIDEKDGKFFKIKKKLSNFKNGSISMEFNKLKTHFLDFRKSIHTLLSDFSKSSEASDLYIAISAKVHLSKASSEKSLTSLKHKNELLIGKIDRLNTQNYQLSNDLTSKTQELERLLIESASLKGKLASFETEISKLQKTESQNQELIDKLNNSLIKLDSLKSNNFDLVTELERFKKLNFETSSINEKLSLHINKLNTENLQLKNDLEVYSVKLIEKTKQIEILSDKQQVKNDQIDNKDFEKQLKLKKQELHQIHIEAQGLQKKVDEKNKIIEELSKKCNLLRIENEKSVKDSKSLLGELNNCKEKLEDKENSIKRLNDTVIDLEKLLQSSQRNEEELRIVLSRNDSHDVKGFQNSEDRLGLPPRPDKRSIQKQSCSALAPPLSPYPGFSKGNSFNSPSDTSEKMVPYTEEMNITPCKVLKVIKVQNKKWVLCQDDEGECIWKNETGLHISGAENLLEAEEDIEEIRSSLGDYFKGSIISAIQLLKEKAESQEFSVHLNHDEKLEVASHSFREELFDVGLDISKIELKMQEHQDIDKVTQELNNKFEEINFKNKKIEKKRRKLSLFKEQINVLKEQMRKEVDSKKDIEIKLESTKAIDTNYLKQVFSNLVSKLKVDKGIEDLLLPIFKILEFTQDEVNKVQYLRKGGKGIKK